MQRVPRFRGVFTSVKRDRLTLDQRAHKNELPFHGQPRTNQRFPHLSHHSSTGATTWGATVLDRPKGPLAHLLRPNTIQSPYTTFGNITCDTPLSHKGVHGASETGSNEPQRLSACSRNKLSGSYTSHDFVTARSKCAITTALQPSTSINMGLIAVPKVESISSSKPSLSDLYLLELQSACRYTPSSAPRRHAYAFYHRIQSTGSHLLIRYDHLLSLVFSLNFWSVIPTRIRSYHLVLSFLISHPLNQFQRW